MKKIIAILFAVITVFGVVRIMQPEEITFDVAEFPFEELLDEVDSPDGKYKIRLYRIGKADGQKNTDGYARLYFHKELDTDGNEVWLSANSKIIYYQEECKETNIHWADHNTVYINNEKLTVPNESFDSRK